MFPGATTTSFRDDFQARSPNRNHLLTKLFYLSQTHRYGRSHTNHSHFTLKPNSPTCTDLTPVGRTRLSHFQFNRHVLLMASLYLRENRHIVLLFVYFFWYHWLIHPKCCTNWNPFSLTFSLVNSLPVFALKTLHWRPTWALMLICEEKYTSRAWLILNWLSKSLNLEQTKAF